eukprot:6191189-Pleurochrysis_carterae.AAC.5
MGMDGTEKGYIEYAGSIGEGLSVDEDEPRVRMLPIVRDERLEFPLSLSNAHFISRAGTHLKHGADHVRVASVERRLDRNDELRDNRQDLGAA